MKGKRVSEPQDIARENLISVTNIIRKERVKVWMVNPKVLLRYYGSTDLWTHPRMYVPITHSADRRMIMVAKLLRQV